MLQENLSSSRTSNFQQESGMGLSHHQQVQWRPEKLFSAEPLNRGFSLDQNQFSPQYSSGDSTVTSQGLPSTKFQIDSSALYGTPSSILQGLLGPDTNQQQQQAASNSFENRPMSFSYLTSYGLNSNHHHELMPSTWSKNICEVRESGSVGKKSGNEGAPKRSRNETPSPLPAFKVQ
ncbi:hypothetical protein RJT34_12661 [Clitoria ternatea]|uniref:Uncharacterized protein n=1 Tax=Clitoria ternatea TaxID=43366 RepID=A0AAN9JPB8_CLITE